MWCSFLHLLKPKPIKQMFPHQPKCNPTPVLHLSPDIAVHLRDPSAPETGSRSTNLINALLPAGCTKWCVGRSRGL